VRLAHRPTQSALPGRTPLDIRLGLTNAADVAHPLRWGILGAANICADWVRALANVPGASVVAVAARSAASAQSFADEWGIARAYEGYEKLAADGEVDVVYCGTITPLHKEHVLMMIEAGKHVLVEKPMSMSAAESEAMYAAAAAKGVMMQEGMWSRFFPATEHARALIEAGAIGDVKVLQGDFGFSGMGQSAEDMAAKRAIHNPSMSCYVAQTAPLAFGTCTRKGGRKGREGGKPAA
jgi:predicted dehydrogenase